MITIVIVIYLMYLIHLDFLYTHIFAFIKLNLYSKIYMY